MSQTSVKVLLTDDRSKVNHQAKLWESENHVGIHSLARGSQEGFERFT